MERSILEGFPELEYRNLAELDREKDIILLTNTHTRLSDLPPEIFKRTKLILHPNSGYDHFASDLRLWENIPLVIGHEIRAQAVAEYSLGCLFEGLLNLPQHLSWDKGRRWDRSLLKNQTVIVFGYGHIGKIVADTLKTLGMKVLVVDPFIQQCPHPLYKTWKDAPLIEARAIISCMSLNSSSKKIFNQEFFKSLNPEIIFINGARGGLVSEVALREFLLANPLSFAFLDVFEMEPFTEEWHHFPQVWKTSHIAGVHRDLDAGILAFEKKVLSDFLGLSEKDFSHKYKQELLQFKRREGELI